MLVGMAIILIYIFYMDLYILDMLFINQYNNNIKRLMRFN
jgi:hypothetical protein